MENGYVPRKESDMRFQKMNTLSRIHLLLFVVFCLKNCSSESAIDRIDNIFHIFPKCHKVNFTSEFSYNSHIIEGNIIFQF